MNLFGQAQGHREMYALEIDEDATGDAVLTALAEQVPDLGREGLILFVEDGDDPIEATVPFVEVDKLCARRVHAHHCHRVEVTVNYNNDRAKREFAPSATIRKVGAWAIEQSQFGLDRTEAAEFVLQLCNDPADHPDQDVHIGTLTAGGSSELCLDLAASPRPQG